jgi:MFS transporter, FHS family, glucose/mannose:H+ symporter
MSALFRTKLSLFINYFVFAILLNSVGTVILQVQNNFGVSKGAASVLEGFKDLSIAIASFLVASYVVRIGYKRTMLIALGIVAAICFVTPMNASFGITKLLFMAVGISFALIKVSVYSTISLVTEGEKEHLSLMNFLESFFMIGILSGNFLFSFFVDDKNPQSTAWFSIYYLLGALVLVAFALLFSTPLDESKIKSTATKSLQEDFVDMLKLIAVPLVLVFIFSAFFYVLIEQSIMSWLPTFNNDVLKLPTSLAIQMASVLSLAIAVGRFLAGFVLQKFDWLIVLVACLVGAAGMVLLTVPLTKGVTAENVTALSQVPLVAFAFPLIGLFLAPIYPAINSVILSTLPAPKHAAVSGLIVVFSALGGTTGSIITGHIFEAFGGQSAFYFSLLPIVILIVLLFFFKKMQVKAGGSAEIKMTGGGH